jgi:hypothetical protein
VGPGYVLKLLVLEENKIVVRPTTTKAMEKISPYLEFFEI